MDIWEHILTKKVIMFKIEDVVLKNITLKKFFYRTYNWLFAFGFDPVKFIRSIRGLRIYFFEYWQFRKQNNKTNIPMKLNAPCLHDRYEDSGTARGGYFFGDLYVAQEIFQNNPQKHIDLASRIDGLVAHIATFRKVEVFDIRKLDITIPNINFTQVNFMSPATQYHDYCDSLSCLHALEHFGLGRYGDPIDPNGHLKGLISIYQILKNKGVFYLGLPLGEDRIDFNAHRVFSIRKVLELTKDKFTLVKLKIINDFGYPIEKEMTDELMNNNFGCHYGYGIYILKKI